MRTYIWITACLYLVSIFGKLIWLSKNEFPERSAQSEAFDLGCGIVMIIWASILIARGW